MANSLSRRPSRRPLASRVKFSDFYELLGPLGAGAFAQVFRGKDLQTGRLVAVKIISKVQSIAVSLFDAISHHV